MSELIKKYDDRAAIRWKLLTGVSICALTVCASSACLAKAEDSNQPEVWIELGGQLSRLSDKSETFVPDFLSMRPSIFSPSQEFEKPSQYGFDETGAIRIQPVGSDWTFSASLRYGRTTKSRRVHQQTYPANLTGHVIATFVSATPTKYPRAARFADTAVRDDQSYLILDFAAGKDVGLGLFGGGGSSTVNLGIRIAQFQDKSNISLKSDPDWRFKDKYFSYYGLQADFIVQPYHSNIAEFGATRSFRGLGPSLSWNGSTPFAGNPHDGELDFHWGVNAALLFGRQKTRTEHHATVRYNDGGLGGVFGYGTLTTVTRDAPPPQTRSRNVVVPNIGGSAGLSWRLQNFKMSLGYRVDWFFNAVDGGIDAQRSEDRGFHGPYASMSIGPGG